MATLTPVQTKLTGLYLGADAKTYSPYWNRFLAANVPFMSETEDIKLDELFQEKVKGSILGRDEMIPAINVDGKKTMTITPAIVGEKIPTKATDSILAAAVVAIEGTQVVDTKARIDQRNVSRIRTSIENKTEDVAAELFLEGSSAMTTEAGRTITYDLGLNARAALNLSAASNLMVEMSNKAQDYFAKWGRFPLIEVGKSVFSALANEINNAQGKRSKLDYQGRLSTDGMTLEVEALGFSIRMLEPATKASNGAVIDTALYMQVYAPAVLVACYAGLEAVGANEDPMMVMSRVLVDKNIANKETGRGSTFGKSAPFPAITYVDMFDRYTVTLP